MGKNLGNNGGSNREKVIELVTKGGNEVVLEEELRGVLGIVIREGIEDVTKEGIGVVIEEGIEVVNINRIELIKSDWIETRGFD